MKKKFPCKYIIIKASESITHRTVEKTVAFESTFNHLFPSPINHELVLFKDKYQTCPIFLSKVNRFILINMYILINIPLNSVSYLFIKLYY